MYKILIFSILLIGCSNATKTADDKPHEISSAQKIEKSSGVSLGAEEAFEMLKPLALKSKYPTTFMHKDQFSITLPSEKERGDEKGEWISSHITVFFKDPSAVDQIIVVTENCNVTEEKLNKNELEDRIAKIVKTVSAQLFGSPFEMPKGRYFKELGPNWQKQVNVSIAELYAPVRSMRLQRGMYKCDSRSGYGYRYDFFM